MKENKMRFSHISLECLAKRVLGHLWIVAAAGWILFMTAPMVLGWIHRPVYQADVTCAVAIGQNSVNSASPRKVALALSQMLETPLVRDTIRSADPGLRDFDGTISASVVGESNFVVVSLWAESPQTAGLALDALIGQFPTLASYLSENVRIRIIRDTAVSSESLNQTDIRHFRLLAGIAGILGMAALICWISIRRETVQTPSGARHLLNAGIIATVPRERQDTPRKSTPDKKGKPLSVFATAASFTWIHQIQAVCTRILQEGEERGGKIFLVTGAAEQEGSSTIAANVASSLAEMGKSVALLDCDLRNPGIFAFFDCACDAPMPLDQMLSQPFSRENLLQCIQRQEAKNLFLLCARKPHGQGPELLAGKTMEMLLQQLRVFDYVILDSPPMGCYAETEVLAHRVDATLLVVRQDHTPAPEINRCIQQLRGSGSSFLGCILNDMTPSCTGGFGYHRDPGRKTRGNSGKEAVYAGTKDVGEN